MKLAFVVQRYGLDIAGGAEYHCRLVAEHLARHAQVEVLTTCATDYVSWADHYPEGVETLNGVPVRRFRVKRPRDVNRFRDWSEKVLGGTHEPADENAWLEEEGPYSPRLLAHVRKHAAEFDFVIGFSYRYWTTREALLAASDRAVLVPTAEDDGVYRLGLFGELFRAVKGVVWNSPEERDMILAATPGLDVPGDVVGVGSALPERLDPEGFRSARGIDFPYLIYVGRIDLNKGCRQLFDHFLRYRRERGSNLRLLLVGKPVLPLPQDEGIVHLGFLSDQEKWDAIAGSEALVMPSRYESLSMVTLEAWWARRPVLANARCAVLRGQCVRSNAGLFYSEYADFAEALALLEREPALRQAMGENGRRYFDTHYAWDVVIGKYLALFERLRAARAARDGSGVVAGASA